MSISENTVIDVRGLGKRYQLGATASFDTLRDALAAGAQALIRRGDGRVKTPIEHIWALRDVSFSVDQGEVVGIIGANGAGKSTLLKLLARIAAPTEGEAFIRGRVGSLLEVGTGFHTELTGQENIYLNGAVLGMTRREIRAKLEEIVEFAGVGAFLDTPVKRYSSGMKARLGFAVAAHLEPEVLIVDEVLSVGDAEFQKRCLGKMQSVAGAGRTVLFVSHNMNAVQQLCGRVIHLKNGQMVIDSTDVQTVVKQYLAPDGGAIGLWYEEEGDNLNNPYFVPRRFWLGDEAGQPHSMPLANNCPIYVHIEADCLASVPSLQLGFVVTTSDGIELFRTHHNDTCEIDWPAVELGPVHLRVELPQRFLNEGDYRLELICALRGTMWISQPGANAPAIMLEIRGGLSESPMWNHRRPGVLAPVLPWRSI